MCEDKEAYLYDIIKRMINNKKITEITNDELHDQWLAHNEARELNDPGYFITLEKMILDNSSKKNKKTRDKVYYMYVNLLAKYPKKEKIEFFLEKLAEETDKYIIMTMQDFLKYVDFPEEINYDIIIEHAMSDVWQIKGDAIKLLSKFDSEKSREVLRYWLKKEDEKKFWYELLNSAESMAHIGKAEDIEYLNLHINTRNRDLKATIKWAIEKILEREIEQ